MATSTRTASIIQLSQGQVWKNRHDNVSQQCAAIYNIERAPNDSAATILTDMLECAKAMQRLLQQALTANVRLRPTGGTWSLSAAAATEGWVLDTLSMNLYWIMRSNQVSAAYTGTASALYFAQGGMTVDDLNTKLERNGRALATAGASNGQTIAGAIATGTHGSAFQYGSMTEFVVGLYIVVAPGRKVWLERASKPVVADSFTQLMEAETIRDDQMFNAALVSFGCFGMIAGVLMETDKIYTLECKRVMLAMDAVAHNAMDTMDLSALQLNNTGEIPWHFEITFNPHDAAEGYMRTMYKRGYENYQPPEPEDEVLGPGEGLLGVIGTITAGATPALVKLAVKMLMSKQMVLTKPGDEVKLTTPGDTFTTTTLRGRAMSMELGIPVEWSSRVLNLLLSLKTELDMYVGVISYRWVKQSTATIGFTKFPITATIEFNAALNSNTTAFYNRIWQELETENIPYTLHWGQMNNFTPERVSNMYGANAAAWTSCRNTLLTPEVRAVFTNDFLVSTGLG